MSKLKNLMIIWFFSFIFYQPVENFKHHEFKSTENKNQNGHEQEESSPNVQDSLGAQYSILLPYQKQNSRQNYIYLENYNKLKYQTSFIIDQINNSYSAVIDNNFPTTIFFDNSNTICNNYMCTDYDNEYQVPPSLIFPQNDSTKIQFTTQRVYISFNIKIKQLEFMVCKTIRPYQIVNADAIIGLGKSQNCPIKNILQLMQDNKIITQRVFSVFYGNSKNLEDSIIMFGGYDIDLFEYHNFTLFKSNHEQFWDVSIDAVGWILQSNINNESNSSQQILGQLYGEVETNQDKINQQEETSNIIYQYVFHQQENKKAVISTVLPTIALDEEILQQMLQVLERINVGIKCEIQPFQQDFEIVWCGLNQSLTYTFLFPKFFVSLGGQIFDLNPENYVDVNSNDTYQNSLGFYLFFSVSKQEFIQLGNPFLRRYYTVFNDEQNTIAIGKARQVMLIYNYSYFWYYTLIVLIFFWAIIMITCGVYYKEQINSVMKLVVNILKFLICRDQNARLQILAQQFEQEE